MRRAILTLLLLLALALPGCSKVDQQHFDQLKMGMDESEVKTILGEPDRCDQVIAYRSCRWGSESQHIDVRLVAGKVVLFNARGL